MKAAILTLASTLATLYAVAPMGLVAQSAPGPECA